VRLDMHISPSKLKRNRFLIHQYRPCFLALYANQFTVPIRGRG
jgi:hypothetical protein